MNRILAALLLTCTAAIGSARAAVPPAAALPTSGWLTNDGNLASQRYSPLAPLDRGDRAANALELVR